MTVSEAIKLRKSVRSFLAKPVEEEKLTVVLEAARLAPSASNRQEWRFVVVRDATMRAKLSTASNKQAFVGTAPVVIACCAETDEHVMSCGQACYPIDIAIAVDHMTLAATEAGLGTCWIGAFDEAAVKSLLGIPAAVRVVALLPLGYPADPSVKNKSRKTLNELIHGERW
jgi:nitroreductase